MIVTVKKTKMQQVEVEQQCTLQEYWVVRIIQGVESKRCIEEKDFATPPTDEDIATMLIKHGNRKVFATVEHNYKIVEVSE